MTKSLLEKLEKAHYSTAGKATVDLAEFADVDAINEALAELKKSDDYKETQFDFNEGDMKLFVYDPNEDIDAFEARNPSRQSCGGHS